MTVNRLFTLAFLSTLVAACVTGPAATIPTPVYAQLTPMWCWAASGQMTMSYLGSNTAQCDQANHEFGFTDCCVASGTLPPAPCIHGGYPQYSAWGFSNDTTPKATALTFPQLQGQIAQNKPWAYVWRWTTGGGHVMVGTGWAQLKLKGVDIQLVLINNPEPWSDSGDGGSQYWITYEDYVSGSNHTHGVDYYNITKVASK